MKGIFLVAVVATLIGQSPALAVDIVFDPSCSRQQEQAVRSAFDRATERSQATYRDLNRPWGEWTNAQKAAYLTWFGPYDAKRMTRVAAVLDSIRSQLSSDVVVYNVQCMIPYDPATGDGCLPGDFALVTPNQRFQQSMLFCDAFFGGQPYGGYDTQWGSVLHEVTHSAANTEDHSYSPRHARNLTPSEKVDNADNYEYFFENLYINAGPN
jgi:peptidyl-Lys metalloendopeptidase